jgi:hypothetical protein
MAMEEWAYVQGYLSLYGLDEEKFRYAFLFIFDRAVSHNRLLYGRVYDFTLMFRNFFYHYFLDTHIHVIEERQIVRRLLTGSGIYKS